MKKNKKHLQAEEQNRYSDVLKQISPMGKAATNDSIPNYEIELDKDIKNSSSYIGRSVNVQQNKDSHPLLSAFLVALGMFDNLRK